MADLKGISPSIFLSWEKSHFMIREGIVLGHIVSERGIEVDRAKIDSIINLPPPTKLTPWYAHIVNYLAIGKIPSYWLKDECERFFKKKLKE
ncbi:unnamed protein product [Spirodela intermedia]|uniref:Uncharacterized protein n=1 Tax=Spirodela intermedia TaxID=51605 RepID=A0A7I8LHQ5_SPIIN|nr:unnamed protein product [Spirodela intermedia]